MPRFLLFAARDGEVHEAIGSHPDVAAAERWATAQIVTAFSLDDPEIIDFADAVGETDGVALRDLATL